MRVPRQAAQLSDHQVDDVIGVPFATNAIHVPRPFGLIVVERQQSFIGERVQELDQEKRITGRLMMDQLRQRIRARRFATERIGEGAGAYEVRSASDTMTDVLPGVTLQLNQADPATVVTVSVAQDGSGR